MRKIILLSLISCCLMAFQLENPKEEVVIRLGNTPVNTLFSVRAVDRNTIQLANFLFQPLLDFNPIDKEIVPVLVENRPKSSIKKNGEHHLTFTIRKEAIWDNERPITGQDVAFSWKLLFACGNPTNTYYFANLKSITVNESDAKKFTLIFKKFQAVNEVSLTTLTIYPKYFYDKEGILSAYSIHEIQQEKETIQALETFANNYNKINQNIGYINGSGAYTLTEESKNKFVFERKKNWWCDNIATTALLFKAYPKKVIFKIIANTKAAETALIKGEIDIISQVNYQNFVQHYQKDKVINQQFHLLTTEQSVYSYIGLNINHPILHDKKVRQALAHLMDRQKYSDTTFYGLGQFVEHPFSKKVVEKPITIYDFNLKKAKQLLKEAGWIDRNNNGTLDNAIDGELQEFKISLVYYEFTETMKEGCRIFQENCKKVGIEVTIEGVDFPILIHRLQNKNFDVHFGLWNRPTIEADLTKLFHSSAYDGGNNYSGFQNNNVDRLLESVIMESSFDKRKKQYQEIAEIIKNECPYIFLLMVNNRIMVSKKFKNPVTTSLGFGVYIPALQTF